MNRVGIDGKECPLQNVEADAKLQQLLLLCSSNRSPISFFVNPNDLEWSTTCSGGAGGQNVNRVQTAVILRHVPTGLVVRCEDERSQKRNKDRALAVLTARLYAVHTTALALKESLDRKQQIGSGQRGDKRRTIRVKDGVVIDHVLGKKWKYEDYVKGNW